MRLNPECIRDLLLTIEDVTDTSTEMEYPKDNNYPILENYSVEEVKYHIKQCYISNLIIDVTEYGDGTITINDLHPNGHEFIANIRSDKVWNKTKEKAKSIGSFSLDALTKISVNIVSSLIKENI